MHQLRLRLLAAIGLPLAGLAVACGGGSTQARLTLQWSPEANHAASIAPSESVRSVLLLRNEGNVDLDSVALRFDQSGQMPFGVSVGTVTNLSSRFEGDVQVWDLGDIPAGLGVAFPVTFWFDTATQTAGPIEISLVMTGSSPDLAGEVESESFEVTVENEQALGQ